MAEREAIVVHLGDHARARHIGRGVKSRRGPSRAVFDVVNAMKMKEKKISKLTLHKIQRRELSNDRLSRGQVTGGSSGARRSLNICLDGLSLVVGVLTSLEVEELGVGEGCEILLHVVVLLGGLLGVDGVEISEVLGHVGAAASVVVGHNDSKLAVKSSGSTEFPFLPL